MFDEYCSNCAFRQKPSSANINQPTQVGGTFGNAPIPQSQMGGGFNFMPGGTMGTGMGTGMGAGIGTTMGAGQMGMGQQMSQPSPIPGVDFVNAPGSPVLQDAGYTQGLLRANIGKFVKIDFLIGTNMLVDREGTIVDVGISYVTLRESETDDLVSCDIYSIKFVRVYY